MTDHDHGGEAAEAQKVAVEMSLRPEGVLGQVAASVLAEQQTLTPSEAGEIILPPKKPGETYEARWELIENAPGAVKEAVKANEDTVFALAEELGMRKSESVTDEDIARIDADSAIFVVEGGANRTSVVRRQLAIETMQRLYGEAAADAVVYQFGSDRLIPINRKDGSPNPEHDVAQEIAGDFIPADDTLDEFGLNLASALQAGYEPAEDTSVYDNLLGPGKVVWLQKAGLPHLVLVRQQQQGGLQAGFDALQRVFEAHWEGMNQFQFVIATNGQYRPKDEEQARQWAKENNVEFSAAPVALGDEPGYSVEHNGKEIKTADRQAMAYVNEIVTLYRLQQA